MSAIGTLFAFVYRHARGLVGLAILVGLLSGAAGAAQVAVLNMALSRAAPPAAGAAPWRAAGWHALDGSGALIAAFAVLLFATPAARLLSQWVLVKLGQDMLYELRMQLARSILATPLVQLEQVGPGRLLAALTEDIAVITEALIVIPEVASNGALFAGGLVYLGWLSPALLGVFLLFLVPVLVAYRLPIGRSFERYREAREEQDTLFGFFNGITWGTKELKLNRERRLAYLERLAASAGALRRLFGRANLTLAAVVAGGWMFFMAAVGVIVFGAPLIAPVGREALVGYVLVLLYIRGPLQQVVTNFAQLGRGGVAIAKLERLGLELRRQSEPVAVSAGPAGGGPAPWRRLELAGVRFTFRRAAGDADFVLGPLQLAFQPGEVVFLIGGNGSGKTSFAKLLVGLYEPESGDIRWDGERVERATLERYRQHFAAVFFDFHLFEDLPGAADGGLDERSRQHLRELQLEGKVDVQAGRLSTLALSQGQRKRLALLAAYLEDRPFYLFDEWAADQDPYFKEIFYRRLLPRLKAAGKTVLVISHDDRYFDVADRVVRFSEGQIVWDGPVDDLAGLRAAMLADAAPRVPAAAEG